MSLIGALYVGRTGLAVSQAALEVAGNNLANAANESYSRQTANVTAGTGIQIGPATFVGTGVRLQNIQRHVDEALNSRFRSASSDSAAAQAHQDLLSQIESIEGELTDQGLSTQLSNFFNTWNQLAANPTDSGIRSLVVSQGRSLADSIQKMNTNFVGLRKQTDDSLHNNVDTANGLLDQIASLNARIVVSEEGAGGNNDLRDQRDKLLSDLSEYVNFTTVEQPNGSTDVFVNSIPVVLAAQNRGLNLSLDQQTGKMKLTVNTDGSPLNPTGGKIGQLMTSRETDVNAAIANLTQFAGQLIYTMNQVHSGGQGTKGFGTLTSDNAVNDPTAALNNPVAGLTFPPTNGTFKLVLKQKSTGQSTTTQINVDLDGIGTDDSLNSLAAKLNTAGITATVTGAGKLKLDAPNSDYEFSFSDDSSGVLASLGLNSFFTGSGSGDIAVNSTLLTDPSYVAATQNSVAGGNANALSIAGLLDKSVSGLGGVSLRDFWARHVEDYATRGAQAKSDVSTTGAIADGLKSQKQAVSGVNMDEEAINLLQFQQAYTGSARFISVVNQMMDTLMNMVQ